MVNHRSAQAAKDPILIDLTSVSPEASGGVGQVARGVVGGIVALGMPARCFVLPGTEEDWNKEFVGLGAYPTFEPVNIAMRADSRWQIALRRILPAHAFLSGMLHAVRTMRSRAVARRSFNAVVWYPFHRSVSSSNSAVVTVHDLRVFEPGLESAMDQKILRSNIKHARALICSWPHPYEHMLRLFPEASGKAFLIPLPVLNPGRAVDRTIRTGNPIRLFYPAFVTPHKNHEVIIRALALRDNFRLICTGQEVEEYARKMKVLAAELGVADRIEWRGHVSRDELEREYAAAHILVMPSKWEAASGPIYEAVVRRLPFVASAIEPLTAQISALGISSPTFAWNDPDQAANAIDRVIESYETYKAELVKPAEGLLKRSWEDTARDYSDVFEWVSGSADKPVRLQGS